MKKFTKYYVFMLAILMSVGMQAQQEQMSELEWQVYRQKIQQELASRGAVEEVPDAPVVKQTLQEQMTDIEWQTHQQKLQQELTNQRPVDDVPDAPRGVTAIGDDCTDPIIISTYNGMTTWSTIGETTCGRVDDYDAAYGTCIIPTYYANGEDIVYELVVTDDMWLEFNFDPSEVYSSIWVMEQCPDVGAANTALVGISEYSNALKTFQYEFTAGQYYIQVDSWPSPDCISFDLHISEWSPGDDCTNPSVITASDGMSTWSTIGETTCGRVDDYDASYGTCINPTYYANGEDMVYELVVEDDMWLEFNFDPVETYSSFWIMEQCPDVGAANTALIGKSEYSNELKTIQYEFLAGTYYIQVDSWPSPDCISFDLTIDQYIPPPAADPITSFPYIEDFDDCVFPSTINSFAGGEAHAVVTADAAYGGSGCGAMLDGNTYLNFYHEYDDDCNIAFNNNYPDHTAQLSMNYTPDGSAGDLKLEFDFLMEFSFADYYSWFRVRVKDNTGWNILTEENSGETCIRGDIDWTKLSYDLSSYQTTGQNYSIILDFVGKYEEGYYEGGDVVMIDNLKLSMELDCINPSDLTATSITTNSAYIGWTENGTATLWDIRIGTSGFDTTGVSPIQVTGNPVAVVGMIPATAYDFYVRSDCGGALSDWVGPYTFSTLSTVVDILPFFEDWESNDGSLQTDGPLYSGSGYSWSYETDSQNEGRVRWGIHPHPGVNGGGAMTMDRKPSSGGNYATNYTTLTLDLSAYTASTSLELSFSWTDYGDEEHPEDKVWVRGSDIDEWLEIYDFNPQASENEVFQTVKNLDIDATLALGSQTVSSTFQLRFGQKDDYDTQWDGITVDDILIEDSPGLSPITLPYIEDWETESGELNIDRGFYSGSDFDWCFETDHQTDGRVRWGVNTHQANTGSGAMTMDRNPSTAGDYVVNSSTLTLNLSDYASSTNLALSFWWTDHGDEDHAGDKVWIRGSDSDPWVELYAFNPKSAPDNVYQQLIQLDIDATLAAASQTVSSTFQLKFGQQDDYNTDWDGISIDDLVLEELPTLNPITLPYSEDWETESGELYLNSQFYYSDDFTWSFETNLENEGRIRWGTNTYQAHSGSGAMTMDRNPSSAGNYAVNSSTLTLDLTNYVASTDLTLSFWWAEHGDEDHAGDKVWVRGSEADPWVELFDFNPKEVVDNTYQYVELLDIDATLASASQTVSSTFGLRFGQEDDYNTTWDGITVDDITIDIVVPPSAPKTGGESDVLTSINIKGEINVYASGNNLFIQSSGKYAEQVKDVQVYDLFGRMVLDKNIPPSSLEKISVTSCGCYYIVKVRTNNEITTHKVFVK